MPYYHARPTDTLLDIVERECPHFSVNEIKAHPKNAELFKARSEHILKAGDPLWIPEEEPEYSWASVKVGEELALTVNRQRSFRVVLRYPSGDLVASKSCVLEYGGRKYETETTAEGLLELELPYSENAQAVVRVDEFVQRLAIGGLEPAHTARGVQARLRNLGYAVGPIDGVLGPISLAAIAAFQTDEGLIVTAKLDDATRSRLIERHGC